MEVIKVMNTNNLDAIDYDILPQVTQSPLYVYKRSNIVCFEQKHTIMDVLAIYPSINNVVVKIPAQYCSGCDRLLISEEEFKRIQNMTQYHFIPTRVNKIDNKKYYSPSNNPFANKRDKESPLMLCGYSVSQKHAIPRYVRQDILRFIIENGILPRLDVIKYIESFIDTNGRRSGMESSVQKWADDLHYVYFYDFNIVAKAQVTKIIPYHR